MPARGTSKATVAVAEGSDGLVVAASGNWVIAELSLIDQTVRALTPGPAILDLSRLERLDTAGAWVLHRTRKALQAGGGTVEFANVRDDHAAMLARVEDNDNPCAIEPKQGNAFVHVVEEIGESVTSAAREMRDLLGFLGLTMVTLGKAVVRPSRIRMTSLVYHIEQVGLNAVPIVALISFLIGVVLAYQGATQLRQFGAEIFTVELVAISVLREIGILLTAIIVAGRSGSAFTAQIGSMKLNEEIDAMRTLALDPMEMLVLPRMLALLISLPLLGFISGMMGLLGGAAMCWAALDITPGLFIERLNEGVPLSHFWVGLIKAPFFALMIGLIGCFEGLKVEGSSESVGKLTTKSVVESIFMVMVVDAIFSIYFAVIGL